MSTLNWQFRLFLSKTEAIYTLLSSLKPLLPPNRYLAREYFQLNYGNICFFGNNIFTKHKQ